MDKQIKDPDNFRKLISNNQCPNIYLRYMMAYIIYWAEDYIPYALIWDIAHHPNADGELWELNRCVDKQFPRGCPDPDRVIKLIKQKLPTYRELYFEYYYKYLSS